MPKTYLENQLGFMKVIREAKDLLSPVIKTQRIAEHQEKPASFPCIIVTWFSKGNLKYELIYPSDFEKEKNE